MADTLASEPVRQPEAGAGRHPSGVSLPPTAPKVRITAGLGTAQQKTWNLRRPVTLIGTSRLAHLVLSDESVSRAHCIIVNTGSEVLIKDLYSTNGTQRNDQRIDLAVLNDGDVLRLGDLTLQVAIQAVRVDPGATGLGRSYQDPLTLTSPMVLRGADSSGRWTVERAVTVIGRRPGVSIPLEHPEVSPVHAALVVVGGKPAVFDLGSGAGTWVNERCAVLAALEPGDRLRVGPFEMVVAGAPDVALTPRSHNSLLFEALRTRAAELDRRERQLEEEQAVLAAARAALERERRELEGKTGG
ncbi:MAG: FHA domain-containing protein [Planctomycetota bacterium]